MASATLVPALAAGRLRQLDVLRGVAILLVLGRHLDSAPSDAPGALQVAVDLWMRAGWIGVDLFFVLSGFLVSGLLFREYARHGDVRAGRFLLRRGLKIYPAFYVFLIATAIYAGRVGTRGFVAEALFVQNYVPGLWDHTWSLAVEEHFYLLLTGLMLVLIARSHASKRPRATGSSIDRSAAAIATDPFTPIVPVFVAVAVIALVLRILTARYGSPWYTHHLCPTHLRVDSLLFGVLLSYLAHYRGPALARFVRRHRDSLLLASILCLAPAFFLPAMNVFMETIGFTLLYLGFGFLLLMVLYRPVRRGETGDESQLRPASHFGVATGHAANMHGRVYRLGASVASVVGRGVAWIGIYSYSIYLWHLAVKRWGVPMIVRTAGVAPTGSVAVVLYFASAILIGAAMAWLVESPGLALRDRWFPSRSGRAARPVAIVDSVPVAGAYI